MTDNQIADTGSKTANRRTKIAFLVVLAVAAALVYVLVQRNTPGFNWPEDLDKALEQARARQRNVLVFFTSSPKSAIARRLIQTTLHKNAGAMAKERVIKVNVSLDTVNSDLAARYKISSLPTFVLLSPEGKELNRREGFVGETDFHKGFLDCSKVVKPKQ